MNKKDHKVVSLAPKHITKTKPRYSSKGCQTNID